MHSLTTRLVTLQPPGDTVDALHALQAAGRTGCATDVGRADGNPELPGQPDGVVMVFEITTGSTATSRHDRFIAAAGEALSACGLPYAWRTGDGPWKHGA